MRRRASDRAQRLRLAVDALPMRTKEAMLRGLDSTRIVVGAYVDKETGGICPMLAAHRNGGRTSLASFARAWDRYTDARRPRLATRRELRTLRAMLEASIVAREGDETVSLADYARRIAADREAAPFAPARPAPPDSGQRRPVAADRHRAAELRNRPRWSWLRPSRRYDQYRDLLAAAEEQLSEQRAAELLPDRIRSQA